MESEGISLAGSLDRRCSLTALAADDTLRLLAALTAMICEMAVVFDGTIDVDAEPPSLDLPDDLRHTSRNEGSPALSRNAAGARALRPSVETARDASRMKHFN